MSQVLGQVPTGVSGRHLHLSEAHLAQLFGEGYQLKVMKELSQTGQYAAEETVALVGPKGTFQQVRILGPVRPATQVEISVTDGFALGLRPPVRDSGDTAGSPGAALVGPKGAVYLESGVIAALRHIHMEPGDAERFGVKDGQVVSALVPGERGLVFLNVLVRVRADFRLDFHVDTDEANAAGLKNGDLVSVLAGQS